MKAKSKLVILILLTTLNFSIFIALVNTKNFSFEKPLPYKVEQKIESEEGFKNYYIDFIEANNFEKEKVDILLNHLYLIKDVVVRLDLKFKLIDKNEMKKVANHYNVDMFTGLYIPNKNEILIVGKDTDTSVHEVGHAVYYQLLNKSERSKADILFDKESKGLMDKYGQTSKEEFFAVAFTEYVYSKETLKENCPEMFNIIDNIINNIE